MNPFTFDATLPTRERAVEVGRALAEDGVGRFVFGVDGIWYVSKIVPSTAVSRHVECVIPKGATWTSREQHQA